VLDDDGNPYSKSAIEQARAGGKKVRYIPPEDILAKYGAEMFRLWTAATEFRTDISYTETVLNGLSDWYRKFRNTSRYILGNLADFSPDEHPLDEAQLGELDRYMLARLGDMVARVRAAYDKFEFHAVHRALVDFVTVDLSAMYLDVIKDRLYSDAIGSPSRRAAQAVLYTVQRALATLSAPIMCFTAEDIWQHMPRRSDDPESVHIAMMPAGKRLAEGDELTTTWELLTSYRDLVTKELEAFRAKKNKSVDAHVTLTPRAADRAILAPRLVDLADLFIVSEVSLAPGDAEEPSVTVAKHAGSRCDRCWKWYAALAAANPEICNRCHDAVAAAERAS